MKCSSCLKNKPGSEFYLRSPGVLNRRCKRCVITAHLNWKRKKRAESPGYFKALAKAHYSRPAAKVTVRNRVLKRLYGISLEDFNRLLSAQAGACAICQIMPDKKSLAVDHDHTTGKVRGLLCVACNCGLGNFRESKESLLKAVAYLNEHETGRILPK